MKLYQKQLIIVLSILIAACLIAAVILLLPFIFKKIQLNEIEKAAIKSQPPSERTGQEQIIAPQKIEFKIEPVIAVIPESELLPTNDWKIYRDEVYGIEMKYPKDWYVIKTEYGVNFSTSPTANAYDFNERGEVVVHKNWARATFTFESKSKTKTLEYWIKKRADPGGPGVDSAVQYILLGDKKFLGTNQFIQNSWKNAYFEISNEKILIISFTQKSDKNQANIFYTMIKALKFVTGY